MDNLALQVWLGFGILCILAELIVPGLVLIFIGLGALTVSLAMQQLWITDLSAQLILFFISSLIYLFTLRILVVRILPSDVVKEDINEDHSSIGEIAIVVDDFDNNGEGRVTYSDSSWPARCVQTKKLMKNDKVKITGRDNITWLVEKI